MQSKLCTASPCTRLHDCAGPTSSSFALRQLEHLSSGARCDRSTWARRCTAGTIQEAIAGPLCQYAAEWWRATDSSRPAGTLVSLGFLVNALGAAQVDTDSSGPLSALMCSLHRIGCLSPTPSSSLRKTAARSRCC